MPDKHAPSPIFNVGFPAPKEIQHSFAHNFEQAKPYLFRLAERVLAAYPDRKWELLVSDETSGVLPARFIHGVLATRNIELLLKPICGSHTAQRVLPPASYDHYADVLANSEGEPNKVLVVTESAGTGDSMRFLDSHLRRRFSMVDFAVVAAHYRNPPDISGKIYLGGHSARASRAVYRTFERVGGKSAKDVIVGLAQVTIPSFLRSKLRSNISFSSANFPITGIVFSEELMPDGRILLPVARHIDDPRYRDTILYCEGLIDKAVKDFCDDYR